MAHPPASWQISVAHRPRPHYSCATTAKVPPLVPLGGNPGTSSRPARFLHLSRPKPSPAIIAQHPTRTLRPATRSLTRAKPPIPLCARPAVPIAALASSARLARRGARGLRPPPATAAESPESRISPSPARSLQGIVTAALRAPAPASASPSDAAMSPIRG